MKRIRRVLVVIPYGIGDLLFVTPVLRALRLLPAVERVDLILGSRTDGVVKRNPHVDSLFVIDKDLMHRRHVWANAWEIFKLTRTLRKRRYDLMLDYSQRQEYGFWAKFFLGIPVRAGFSYKRRGIFLNRLAAIPEGFCDRHVVDDYCRVAEAAGVSVRDRYLEYYVSETARDKAEAWKTERAGADNMLQPYFVVSPGGGESWGRDAHFKRWPSAYFADLIQRMIQKTGIPRVFILGSANEKSLADEIVAACKKGKVFSAVGELSFGVTAALLEQSRFFIGNDGGLLHLAKALHVPVIGLYGPVDPQVYGPYPLDALSAVVVKEGLACRPCYRKFRYDSACTHRNCLKALMPQEVEDTLNRSGWFEAFAKLHKNEVV